VLAEKRFVRRPANPADRVPIWLGRRRDDGGL